MVQVNAQAQELFGYDRDELIGQKVEMLVPESYRRSRSPSSRDFAHQRRRRGAWERNLDLYGRRVGNLRLGIPGGGQPPGRHGERHVRAERDSPTSAIASESPKNLRRANEELHRTNGRSKLGEYRSRLALIIDSSDDAIIG